MAHKCTVRYSVALLCICDQAADCGCLPQVRQRLYVHGGKPGPVFAEARADPDSQAVGLAISFADLSRVSTAAGGSDLSLDSRPATKAADLGRRTVA